MLYDRLYTYKKIEIDNNKIEEFFIKEKIKSNKKENSYLAVIEIPKINLKKGFYNYGSIHNNINESIMLLKPIEQEKTIILAAHSGNSNISYFKNLYKLSIGDVIYIYFDNKKYKYEIVKYYEEDKDGNITIFDNNSIKKLVLTTCKSFNKQLTYIAYLKEAKTI